MAAREPVNAPQTLPLEPFAVSARRARPPLSGRRLGVALGICLAVGPLSGCGAGHRPSTSGSTAAPAATARPAPSGGVAVAPASRIPRRRPGHRPAPLKVAVAVLHLVDPSRTMVVSGHTVPRAFVTIIRYPVGRAGPFPLIVFGHGFTVTPAPYARLLDAWARAGYVVAAPVFPLESAGAPGGPDERDLVNQPGDLRLLITSLLTPASAGAAKLARLIDGHHIAVAGQSDGGDTALATAYDPAERDPRVRAAIILSGAEDPFARAFAMPAGGPPLLATQGTADTINPLWQTLAFFRSAAPPKYLLELPGAGHLAPYAQPGPELKLVEHMTLAFLARYFKGRSPALARYLAARSAGPGSVLIAQP